MNIDVTVELDVRFSDDIAKQNVVEDKERAKDKTLWTTRTERRCMRDKLFYLNKLSTVRKLVRKV